MGVKHANVAGSDRWLTELGLGAMVLIWGLNFVIVKWALAAFEPLGFNALRQGIAALFMLGFLRLRGPLVLPERADVARILAMGFIGNIVYQVAFITGMERTRAGNASLMIALVPIFLLIFGGKRVERGVRNWLGALLSISGVALVSATALQLEGREGLIGDALLIGAAASWAIYTLGSQQLIDRYGSVHTTAWTLWVGAAGLVLLGIPSLVRQEWGVIGVPEWGGVFYSGVLAIGVAYLLWYHGVQRLGGARTAIFANLPPVVALGVGALWLGEQLTVLSILGAVMVIGGLLLVRSGRSGRPAVGR